MKTIETLILGIVIGLAVSEIVRQYEPMIGYIIYVGIPFLLLLNIYIYWKTRIVVKIIRQDFFQSPYSLQFEAINLGEKKNSLEEYIDLCCVVPTDVKKFPLYGIKHKCKFQIPLDQRLLEPHKPEKITATCDDVNTQSEILVSWFRKYTFKPSKGMYTIKYVRNVDNGIPKWRYRFERFLYRGFRIINKNDYVEVE
jgi:hypothetical protein